MKRFGLLCSGLIILSLALSASAQKTTAFDVAVRGAGIVNGYKDSGKFEMSIMKAGNEVRGGFAYVQRSISTTNVAPVMIVAKAFESLTVEGRTAVIKGKGYIGNNKPVYVTIVAMDLVYPGSPLTVLDNLAVEASTADGVVYSIRGYVAPGDVAIIYPPKENILAGVGVIQATNSSVGILDVKIRKVEPSATIKGILEGGFTFREMGMDSTTLAKPKVLVVSRTLRSFKVDGNYAEVVADVSINGRAALAFLEVADNQNPTGPTDALPDKYHLIVMSSNATVIYEVGGPLIRGDLVVK